LDEEFAHAMRSEGADDLLRLLRNVYFQQESTGSADVDMAAAPAISASSLGLIESKGSPVQADHARLPHRKLREGVQQLDRLRPPAARGRQR